jgi:hypothetical protein
MGICEVALADTSNLAQMFMGNFANTVLYAGRLIKAEC